MKRIVLVLLIVICSNELSAQKKEPAIESAVVGFFNGLSLLDADTLHYYTTSDFQLLENGHIWNLDTLIARVMPRKKLQIQRLNKFDFIRTELSKDMAWISYHNSAEFSLGEKKQTVKWIESSVLVKVNGRWRIQMLHSTKLP